VRRRFRYVAVIAPLLILLAVYLSFSITPLYESTATIMLEPSSVNKDVVTSTVISYSNDQIEIVQGKVMTNEILKELVKQYDPYPGSPLTTHQKALQILQDTTLERVDPVTLKPLQESNAFSLHYRNPDPERAAEVTSRLAQLFLTYNQRSRQMAAQSAAVFLRKQAEGINKQVAHVDDQLKVFKAQHGDALPEDVQRNQAAIDRDTHELENLQQEILRSQEKESLLSVQLSQTSPNMITQAGDLTDLATVRAQLAEAQQRYTPDHPEVKRLQRALKLLSDQQGQVAAGGIVKNANNPQYLTTASQLTSARAELAGLRGQEQRLKNEIAQYEQLLSKAPGVEREYTDIMRARTSLQNVYQQLQDKLQKAEMAQSFETEEGGERFLLLRAPFAPRLPVYPNRIGLILLGVVLGLALSGVAVAIAESGDSNIRNVDDFPQLPGVQVLASIPNIANTGDRRRRRVALMSWVTAYCVAIFFVVGVVLSALK